MRHNIEANIENLIKKRGISREEAIAIVNQPLTPMAEWKKACIKPIKKKSVKIYRDLCCCCGEAYIWRRDTKYCRDCEL